MVMFVLWDDSNRRVETFAGPHRLAKWAALPEGWCIEEFQGDVSRGMTSLESVKAYAAQLRAEVDAAG